MIEALPDHVGIIATHPLFGPDSISKPDGMTMMMNSKCINGNSENLKIKISEEKLQKELYVVEEERVSYEKTLTEAKTGLSNKSQKLDDLKEKQSKLKAGHYNANMIYQGQKAEIDALKYLVEAENSSQGHDDSHGPSHKDEYVQELDLLHTYKMTKEDFEIQLSEVDVAIKDIQSEVKKRTR